MSNGARDDSSSLFRMAPAELAGAMRGLSAAEWGAALEELQRLAISDLGLALEASDLVLRVADEVDDVAVRAHARRARAHALAYGNRLDDALGVLEDAARLIGAEDHHVVRGHVCMAMLHVLNRLGRSDEALDAGAAALQSFQRAGEPMLAARADANLGVVHRTRLESGAALEHFDRARDALAVDRAAIAQIDSNRAEVLLDLNRFAESEAAFRQALDTFESSGWSRAIAIVEGNLGDLMARQGRISAALHHFERARRAMDREEAPGDLARIGAEQAEALLAAGLWADAVEQLESAVPELDATGLVREAARGCIGLGRALVRDGRLDAARAVLDDAKGRVATMSSALIAEHAMVAGELAFIAGDHAEARAELERARALLAEAPVDACRAGIALARLALGRGDHVEATQDVGAAIETAGALGVTPLLADALAVRAALHRHAGRLDDAIADLRESVRCAERVRGSLQAERLRTAFVGQVESYYDALTRDLLERGGDAVTEAFAVTEQARLRALLDIMSGSLGAGDDESPGGEGMAEILRLRRELNGLYSRALDDEPIGNGGSWTDAIGACERQLERAERRQAVARGPASVFARAATWEEIRGALPRDVTLVEYVIVGDQVNAIVGNPDRDPIAASLPQPLREVLSAIERLSFQIVRVALHDRSTRHRDDALCAAAEGVLRRLHALLIAPVLDLVRGSRLHIVPHRALHAVPFHALMHEDRALIDDWPMTVTLSATLLRHLEPAAFPDSSALQVAIGVDDARAPRIAEEIDAMERARPGLRVLRGAAATADALRAETSGARLLHLATHGRFTPEHPLGSGVRLADGWFTARDFYDLRLDRALVTLSGCETAAAAVRAGDELQGLTRGIFAGGAHALLTTLWPTHDASAAEFIDMFYGRPAGTSPVAAWRQALRELRANRRHPAQWAPFALFSAPDEFGCPPDLDAGVGVAR